MIPPVDAGCAQPAFDKAAASLSYPEELVGVRVLVVDDEDDVRDFIACVLEECRVHVASAASVSEALRLFENDRPEVLISDLGMPQQSGYDLIRIVRSRGPRAGGALPAVALSAYARAVDSEHAVAAGFDAHLAKPIEPRELVNALRDLVRRARERSA